MPGLPVKQYSKQIIKTLVCARIEDVTHQSVIVLATDTIDLSAATVMLEQQVSLNPMKTDSSGHITG